MKAYKPPFAETVTATDDTIDTSVIIPGKDETDVIPWFMGGGN